MIRARFFRVNVGRMAKQPQRNLEVDQVVNAPFLPEPSIVKKVEDRENHTKVEFLARDSNQYMQHVLPDDQLTQIEVVETNEVSIAEDSEEFFFYTEANRIRLSHQFDPLHAINVSQVDPLPHQIKAVYDYILERPRVRFLLADDPGAGKTIMAGLALKEMQQRKLVERCLVVSPGHLQEQWQREMKEKFRTNFRIIQREGIRSSWAENIWEEQNYCITSMDFAKQEDILQTMNNVQWDLVIVDEAHKMAAYQRGDKIEKTQRYRLGELLSEQSMHLLFLTATPHKGDEQNFRLFLDLLEPGMFSDLEILRETLRDEQTTILLRRLKEDLRGLDGEKIFPPRKVRTVRFSFNRHEEQLYRNVTEYVQDYFDQAKENRHISFALMVLQRRLSSSVPAILKSLERRRSRLRDLHEEIKELEKATGGLGLPEEYRRIKGLSEQEVEEQMEDMPEAEREKMEERMEKLTIAENIEQLEAEIRQLDSLVEEARQTNQQGIESKLQSLKDEILDRLDDRKLLIFTQFRDTLSHLVDELREWGYSVTTIHGGMNLDARIDAEYQFKHNKQIMVATEAAGEGINLQFCSWMVNYDIPWNPNRLEQRMGRVHRYGQDEEVHIFNMITRDSMEGEVLDKLFDKLNRMKEHLGSDQVFDVIGELFEEHDLGDLIEQAITKQRTLDDISGDIDELDARQTRQRMEKIFLKSLATEHIDFSSVLEKQVEARENRLVPEYIREYFLRALDRLGGEFTDHDRHVTVNKVPFELRKYNRMEWFKNRYGKVRNNYKRVVFEKDHLDGPKDEFVAPGHPLLESVNQYVLEKFKPDGRTYALFADPDEEKKGVLWFVEGEVSEGNGEPAGKRLFSLYQDTDGHFRRINPSILWDMKPTAGVEVPEDVSKLLEEDFQVDEYVMKHLLLPYRNELQEQRNRVADIKEDYGIKSLKNQIMDLEAKNLEYEQRLEEGETAIKGQITMNERKIEDLEDKKRRLKQEIENQRNLAISTPKIVGASIVLPLSETEEGQQRGQGPGMSRDEEVEKIAIQVAMEHEREHDREPESVEEENLGFDLRSWKQWDVDENQKEIDRYIEVKGRAETGNISLTMNEWMKAERFGHDYWLYVVTNTAFTPDLKKIRNPAEQFDRKEILETVRLTIPEEDWKCADYTGE